MLWHYGHVYYLSELVIAHGDTRGGGECADSRRNVDVSPVAVGVAFTVIGAATGVVL